MCGLFGGMSHTGINKTERAFIKGLFYVNAFRGIDSTGVFDWIQKPEKVKEKLQKVRDKNAVFNMNFWKRTVSPSTFAETKYNELCEKRWAHEDPKFIACHNRLATIGSVTQNNAHPFYFPSDEAKGLDGLIGMHNGTIYGEFSHRKDFNTDSEALYYNIYKYGLEETLDRIKNYNPAYALVWFNTTQRTLHFFRNKERPLWYMGQLVKFWSSEEDALLFVQRYTRYSMGTHEFKKGVLYTFDVDKMTTELQEKEIKVPEPRIIYSRGQSAIFPTHHGKDLITGNSGNNTSTGTAITTNNNVVMRVPPARRELPKDVKYDGCEADLIPYKNGFFDTYLRSEQEILDVGRLVETGYAYFFDEVSKKYFTPYWAGCLDRVRWDAKQSKSLMQKIESDAKKTMQKMKAEVKNATVHEVFRSYGFENRRRCTELAYRQKIEKGCCYCGDPVALSDKLHWVDDDDFLCIACQEKAKDPASPIHELFKYYQTLDLISTEYLDDEGKVIQPTVILH